MTREITPQWQLDNWLKSVEGELENKDWFVVEWIIEKASLIATLNFLRGKGYKCQWIQKDDSRSVYTIKISKTPQP